MEQWLPFIQDYGFPVVVTFYLLHRIEVKLDSLNKSIIELPERMNGSTIQAHSKKTM
ncbi:YvrJ family protein [Bacillus sp. Marseille-P3661]|uniref:YvrJ family protein n=1 Tax=Bacillus sp. Marseille-P3661 TaxID=1936234 RepID=UPI000C81ECC8|nr:YvrJ family protein [Bacillus sp. Marseille-P3661]